MGDLHPWVTTGNGFDGYKVVKSFGVVRGITVRSRSVFGSMGASLQTLVGGKISLYVELAEAARREAYELMIRQAADVGANAVIAVRYDAAEMGAGITEMVCYGTAVQIAPES
jgi:uncharacterized protein YbjQ (UPF0145 family)